MSGIRSNVVVFKKDGRIRYGFIDENKRELSMAERNRLRTSERGAYSRFLGLVDQMRYSKYYEEVDKPDFKMERDQNLALMVHDAIPFVPWKIQAMVAVLRMADKAEAQYTQFGSASSAFYKGATDAVLQFLAGLVPSTGRIDGDYALGEKLSKAAEDVSEKLFSVNGWKFNYSENETRGLMGLLWHVTNSVDELTLGKELTFALEGYNLLEDLQEKELRWSLYDLDYESKGNIWGTMGYVAVYAPNLWAYLGKNIDSIAMSRVLADLGVDPFNYAFAATNNGFLKVSRKSLLKVALLIESDDESGISTKELQRNFYRDTVVFGAAVVGNRRLRFDPNAWDNEIEDVAQWCNSDRSEREDGLKNLKKTFRLAWRNGWDAINAEPEIIHPPKGFVPLERGEKVEEIKRKSIIEEQMEQFKKLTTPPVAQNTPDGKEEAFAWPDGDGSSSVNEHESRAGAIRPEVNSWAGAGGRGLFGDVDVNEELKGSFPKHVAEEGAFLYERVEPTKSEAFVPELPKFGDGKGNFVAGNNMGISEGVGNVGEASSSVVSKAGSKPVFGDGAFGGRNIKRFDDSVTGIADLRFFEGSKVEVPEASAQKKVEGGFSGRKEFKPQGGGVLEVDVFDYANRKPFLLMNEQDLAYERGLKEEKRRNEMGNRVFDVSLAQIAADEMRLRPDNGVLASNPGMVWWKDEDGTPYHLSKKYEDFKRSKFSV